MATEELLKLSDDEVARRLVETPGWALSNGQIAKTFTFDSYMAGADFVSKVATLAEELQHHPDVHLYWRRVELAANTHDVGGISYKDFELAKRVEQFV